MRSLSAAVLAMSVVAGGAVAHEGHEHKAMGTVAAVDAKHIEVADKDGKKTSIQLTPDTKYLHGTMAAELSHVAVGQRVVVVYVQDEMAKTNVAKQVTLGVPEKQTAPMPMPHQHD